MSARTEPDRAGRPIEGGPGPGRSPAGLRPPRSWTSDAVVAAAILYFVVYLSWLVFQWGGPDLELVIGDTAIIPPGVVATWFALRARGSARTAGGRRAWGFFALGFAAYCVGDVLWFWLEIIVGADVPVASAADVGYLAFYPLLLLGLWSLAGERSAHQFRTALDLAIVVVGTGTVVWVLVLSPVASASEGSPLDVLFIGMAYPIGDVVVLFALAAALMRRLTDTSRPALFLLGAGLFLNVVGDLVYSRLVLDASYESASLAGGLTDVAYMAGWLAMALSGYAQARSANTHESSARAAKPTRPMSLVPYGAVLLLYALLVAATVEPSLDLRAVVLGAVIVTGLVMVRQVVTVRENGVLLDAQLRFEARFRALIQNSTDVIAVTDAAGTITYVTPSATGTLERDPGSLVGTPLAELVGEDAPLVASLLGSASAPTGASSPVELRLAIPGASARFVEMTAMNLLGDPNVRGIVVTIHDVTDRKDFEEQLRHQAFHDPLTGLANRALLANRVEHALSLARRRTAKPAVIYLDLDDFKRINDSLGHETGDRVLQEVASRLLGTLREGDTAARLGGDEFAILVEETATVEDATVLAQRIEGELVRPIEFAGTSLSITASLGVVRADDGVTGVVELLRNADIARYEAKREARGGHRIFEPSMFNATVQRVRLEDDLRHALDNGELALVFQPLVDLANRRPVGIEALLRWNHPRRGLVMPLTFIPLAEQTGEIVRIGRWVIEETCRVVGGWNRRLESPLRANVNVSVRQLVPSFVDDVRAILERTGFPPELLVLELTESVLAANPGNITVVLARLRGLGVRMAIDDFGTGYSSLSYLQDLPVDEIKIDRSFVQALTQLGDASLVSTIIQLGRRLGISTIAEGIEQEDQATRLRALGCEFGQGYLFDRPAPAETVLERLVAGERNGPAIVSAVPGGRSA